MSLKEDAEDQDPIAKTESSATGAKTENEDDPLIDEVVLSEATEATEFTDPAILAVSENPKLRYSKDELIELREAPLSRKKPDFINTEKVPQSIWDPELWSERNKRSSTPTDQAQKEAGPSRRSGDPRERIRKENDGIVLSPQRRSFNSGCFVPSSREQPPSLRPGGGGQRSHSPIGGGPIVGGKGDNPPHMGIREIPPTSAGGSNNSRRIGSGRILRDSWDFNDKNEASEENDYYRSMPNDRRSFKRDFESARENKDRRGGTGRFGGRRISGCDKDEEPEWFSSGPISQNDTIELRGFDEPEKTSAGNVGANKKKLSSSQAKRVREWAKKKNGSTLEEEPNGNQPKQNRPTQDVPTNKSAVVAGRADKDQDQRNDNNKENRNITPSDGTENINEQHFLLEDLFKCDTIPDLLSNGVECAAENNTKSRFSRWFKQESPEKASDSRRSSFHDDHHHHLLTNILSDINEPATVSIPPQLGNAESYFAPISPAAVNSGTSDEPPGVPKPGQLNIADMFQRGKRDHPGANRSNDTSNTQFPNKMMSLNELESRMRKSADISGNQGQPGKQHGKQDEDMSAFKRLLAQVSGGHAFTANQKVQQMSLLEMLSHSQQQEEVQARLNQLIGGGGQAASPKPNQVHNEFLLKMQHAQQEQQAQLQRQQQLNMLGKLMGIHGASSAASHLRASPLHQEIAQQQSRELLNRPEAQAILQGLKRGDITPQHLYQQLANPALQPRHREMLHAILKVQRVGPSPRVLSPVPPPHHMFSQPPQQQLRVSPLPNALRQRIPSPRELQVHTQNILQRALIKKKLEEQQENYRKKQELQQPVHSPNNNPVSKGVSSPTPLAFTPTSVLRKMTAEKDEGHKDVKQVEGNKFPQGRALVGSRMQQPVQNSQWSNQFPAKQQGRPIVKANTSYPNSGADQFFNVNHQQQSFLFNQQPQQQQQQRHQPLLNATQTQNQYSQQQKQMKQSSGVGAHIGNIVGQYTNQTSQQTQQQFPQLTQQQLRAQHQQQARPAAANNLLAPQQQKSPQQQQSQQKVQDFGQQQSSAWQQFLTTAAQQDNSRGSGNGADGALSPTTTNQLARWFSPDLLEKARGGQLPSTAGLAQHVLSLEEIERQAAPPVHN